MSKRICRDVCKLRPELREVLGKLLARLGARGYVPWVFETWRSEQRQSYLWSIGRRGRRNERPVTWVRHSKHQDGLAVDVVEARSLWSDMGFFDCLTVEAELLGLRTFKRDPCHIEWKL